MVPNFSQTWLRSTKSFVFGKNGQIIPLDRRHDPFTGVLKTEVRERQRRMMATRRWTRRGSQRRATLDVLMSSLIPAEPTPIKAAITKPKAKPGPKRKGARATKKLEQLQSKGHILDPDEATAYRALSARGSYLSADRIDLSFSSKELCREFARPNQTSFLKLKRAA